MLRARHSRLAKRIWDFYLPRRWKRHFRGLRLLGEPPAPNPERALLLLANHISWWDGFTWYLVNERWLKKRFHILMLEETLRKNFFFRYLGGFSIQKGHRSMVETLLYARELLQDPQNLVLIFPQGEIQSQLLCEPELQPGMLRLLDMQPRPSVWMGQSYTDYGSQPQPEMWIRLRAFEGEAPAFQLAFHDFLKEAASGKS